MGGALLDLRLNDSDGCLLRQKPPRTLALTLNMFQNSGIQSTWASQQPNQQQPQQQPQQPQAGSVFGQPSAFGAGGGGRGTQPLLNEL
jgi:hypothetical protein